MDEVTAKVHESRVGTYHPAPAMCGCGWRGGGLEASEHNQLDGHAVVGDAAWTVNDTRGYIDGGSACDECGECECELDAAGEKACLDDQDSAEDCVGLSFAFVCLDGGEALCEECAKGVVEIVPCDCEGA